MRPRVVVTGLGLVTPIGSGTREVWQRFLDGRSGIADVRSVDTTRFTVHRGAEVVDFDAADHLKVLDPADLGRASQFATAAARMALADAGLDPATIDPTRGGVAMGTTSGEPLEVERLDDSYMAGKLDDVGSEFVARYPCHLMPESVAAEVGFAGENMMIPTACAAGNYAIAHAYDTLMDGLADVMLAGGADAFSRITYTGFACLGAIAPEFPQPFDRNRKGMVPGEGAGFLVLEPLSLAQARGARIYAEVAGYGLSCDAFHMTGAHEEGEGAARAMRHALTHARLEPSDISYISAHGTGTPSNDLRESIALHNVFGDSASRIPVSSIKSMIGHTMGAASVIEAAVCSLAVHDDKVPPTINFEEPDPDCRLDCVPNTARELTVAVAMNNAYAFGGNNASVIFRKREG